MVNNHWAKIACLFKGLVFLVYETHHRHAFDLGLEFHHLIYGWPHMANNPLLHFWLESIVICLNCFIHDNGKFNKLFLYIRSFLFIYLLDHYLHAFLFILEFVYFFINHFYGSRDFLLALFVHSLDEFFCVPNMIFHKTLRAKGFLAAIVRTEIAFVETM